jgi:hypothetical protein
MRPSIAFFRSSTSLACERLTIACTLASKFLLRCSASRGDLFLASLLLYNIPRDLGRSDDLACGISHRRNRQGHHDKAAVLTLPNRLEMVYTLAASDASVSYALHPDGAAALNPWDGRDGCSREGAVGSIFNHLALLRSFIYAAFSPRSAFCSTGNVELAVDR